MVPIWFKNVLGIVLICLAAMNICDSHCPDLDDIPQCACELFDRQLVHCTHILSNDQLLYLASKLKGHEIPYLAFQNSRFGLSLPGVFKGIEIEELWFYDCDLPNSGETLEVSVTELYFINTNLVQNGNLKLNLKLLKSLNTLNLEKNRIPKLTQTIASGIPEGLKSLFLTDCAIEEIEEDFFTNLQNLENLQLINNKLKKFPDPLATLPLLEWLDLGSNEIVQLPENFMSSFPKLKNLQLNENKISTFPKNIWKDIFEKINALAIFGNPLVCDNDIKWTLDAKKPRIYYGQCFKPERLKNKKLDELNLEDFQ